ncbi:FGGY family carbohydrate kinase, partial [Escherichia coli]
MARLFTPSESKYYLMALDAGTGSIRAVIFDLEGNQIAVGQAEWRHLAVPDVPGSMEFDLNKNWQLACECMRQALHNAGIAPEYIAAVSACSMREGIVLYNNEGAPIWACANVDARAAREVSELKELHNNTFENEVYRATGQTLALSAIPRLLWLAHHRSDIYRQASTITMISDWLAYMLSGELAVDPSNAGTTGLLDLTTRDWKPALLDMAGLRADILSPVKETGTLLGVVSSQAAELCGLKAGTPVVVGGGDVQLGCLGLGVVRPAQTGFIGGNASGKGIVNISTDSLWNLKTSSTNAQLLQVGVLGTGELNITTGGIVKARDTQIALNDKSKGDVRVDGQNSLLETFNMYVGTSGTGTLTLTNSGTLNVEGGEVYLGVFEPAVGTLNIGAAHGEAAADAGYITNATKVEFGSGEG